jgi:4-hydroxyacetophenone monooxygenase
MRVAVIGTGASAIQLVPAIAGEAAQVTVFQRSPHWLTVPGYPNLFCLYGPNTNLGHGGSAFFQTECQMRYILGCLRLMIERGWQTIECRQDIHDVYNDRVDATHEQLVWTHPGTSNWFRNAAGRVTTNSPWRMIEYWQMTRRPDPAVYVSSPRLT